MASEQAVAAKTTSVRFVDRARRALLAKEAGVLIALLVLSLALAVSRPAFRSQRNLLNVGRQVSVVGIMAVGMTFVLISGEIDVSVGSSYALVAVVAGTLMTKQGWNIWLSCLAGLAVGAFIGWVNGFLSTKGRLPSFISTLGMMSILRGAALLITNAYPVITGGGAISGRAAELFWYLGGGRLFGQVPMQFVWFIVVLVLAHVLLSLTTYGFRVYAVGGNARAAHLCGLNVQRIKLTNFTMLGLLCGLSGLLTLSFLRSVTATIGVGYELDVISAVIIGGAALSGGEGTVLGTLIGAMIMGVLRNGLTLFGVSPFWQQVAIGMVIILAVGLDRWILRRGE